MNPRRPYSNRPGGRGGSRDGGPGGGRGFGGRSRGGGEGGRGGAPEDAPMLLGEPSPSLAKINKMNMAALAAKIVSLREEKSRMAARLERLEALDPQPEDQIKAGRELLARLDALEKAATERLQGKAQRKAEREQRGR